jgi:hypothetical protein
VADLPPKLEVVLSLAPTPQQMALLNHLLTLTQEFGRNVLRDCEVGRGVGLPAGRAAAGHQHLC